MSVAIVGGGLAGLSAAIEAARGGVAVVVYDGRRSLGGRARTHHQAGFRLNEGAHALYVDGPAMAFLRELDREPAGGVPDASGGIGVDRGEVGPLPAGGWSLLRTPLLRGDRLRIARLMAGLGRLDPAEHREATVTDALRGLLGEGRAARLGHALIRLSCYGNDPDHASADAGLGQLKMAVVGGGVRYLHGGWQTIVDGLIEEARSLGVEIRTGAKVAGVRPARDGVEVVGDDGATVHPSVVLAAGGPSSVQALVGDAAPAAAGWAGAARPATVACLDVGLGGGWGPYPTFALGIDEPLYLSVHAPVADLAPEGGALVHVMRYHHPDETVDADADRSACERLLDRVRPGWRDDAVHNGFRPRLVAAHDQARAATGGLAGRPPVAVPGLDGVFQAGDWVGPEGVLVDAVVASGRAAGAAAAEMAGSRAATV